MFKTLSQLHMYVRVFIYMNCLNCSHVEYLVASTSQSNRNIPFMYRHFVLLKVQFCSSDMQYFYQYIAMCQICSCNSYAMSHLSTHMVSRARNIPGWYATFLLSYCNFVFVFLTVFGYETVLLGFRNVNFKLIVLKCFKWDSNMYARVI